MQPDLYDSAHYVPPARELARTTDPETSHEAARAIRPSLSQTQKRVLAIFEDYITLTDDALIRLYRDRYGKAAESTIRTRRKELVTRGQIEDSRIRTRLESDCLATIWKLARVA